MAFWRSGKKVATMGKIWDDANNSKLKGLVYYLEAPGHSLILCTKTYRLLVIVQGTTLIGTVLVAAGFRNFLCARYDVTPPKLLKTGQIQ